MPLSPALLVVLVLGMQPNPRPPARPSVAEPKPDAMQVVRTATRAVERDSAPAAEQRYNRTLASNGTDRAALLALSTLARLTYRFERADSLAVRLVPSAEATRPSSGITDDITVMARMAIASLIVGRSPLRADSVLAQALRDARGLANPRLEATVMVALAGLRARTAGPRVGLSLLKESRQIYPTAEAPEEAARLCLEGGLGVLVADTSADGRILRGVRLARTAAAWRVMAECRLQQAQMLELRGSFPHALGAIVEAERLLRRVHADAALAVALQRGAYVRFQRGDLANARLDYLEAIDRAVRARNASVEAWALGGLGQIAVALNDLSGARTYIDKSLTMHRAASDRWGMSNVQYLQGELFDAMGDVPAARIALQQSVDAYVQTGQRLPAISPLRRLARLELDAGNIDDAERALQRATQFATASGNRGWFAEVPYHQAAVALARGRLDAADSLLRLIERPESLSSDLAYSYWIRVANVASRRNDFAGVERALGRAMSVLEGWRAMFSEKDVRLRIAEARRSWGEVGSDYPALIATLAENGRAGAAFDLAEASRARELASVALQQAALDANANRETVTIARLRKARSTARVADVQGMLDDSTALLAYVAGRGDAPTSMFVVTRSAIVHHRLAPADSVARFVDRYLRLVADGAEPVALARQLGDALLSPALANLSGKITRLIVVPERSLYRVPFDALQTTDGRYAVERFTISISPSASFAVAMRNARGGQSGAMIAFGDATYSGTASLMRTASTSAADDMSGLSRLPYSGNEARRVARYSPASTVLLQQSASEQTLRTMSLANVRILHLATHAVVDDRSLQRSMIALSPGNGYDGRVGATDLGALRLTDALVVLSGCRTVGGVILGGEGLRGLVAPLLEAGASTVLATHWPVGDESIQPMIDRFYRHAALGIGTATALRRAKLDALRDKVTPSVWASFVLIGNGSLRVPLVPISAPPLPWGRGRRTS